MLRKYKPYLIAVLLTLAGGGLTVAFTMMGMDAYETALKPALTPPPILFPIVWSILYILMGISAALVWQQGAEGRQLIRTHYLPQLLFNYLWSLWFFTLQAYLFAFLWLAVLWLLILRMILAFRAVSPAAAKLQIPYLLWVTFAGYLNLGVWLLNR